MKKSNVSESDNKSMTTAKTRKPRTKKAATEPAPAPLSKGAAARRALHELTARLREERGTAEGANRLLIAYYKEQGATELHTYEEWTSRGYQVKKGAKAYAVWGTSVASTAHEGALFFPLKYLFDRAQCVSTDHK